MSRCNRPSLKARSKRFKQDYTMKHLRSWPSDGTRSQTGGDPNIDLSFGIAF
jgi:hypothetical protein